MKNISVFLALLFSIETAWCGQIYKNSNIAIYADYPTVTFEILGSQADKLKSAFVKKSYKFSASDNSLKIDCSTSCKIELVLTSEENLDAKIPFIRQKLSKQVCGELAKKFKPAVYNEFDGDNLDLNFKNNCSISFLNLNNYSNHEIDAARKKVLDYKKASKEKIKKLSGNIDNISWVKNKLQIMCDLDQAARWTLINFPQEKLNTIDKIYFSKALAKMVFAIDIEHNSDLKELLKEYNWFVVSKFGKEADFNGWLLIQHQDGDLEFQKMVLKRLEKLYPLGETRRENYAFLCDRVARAENKPQKYGTQFVTNDNGTLEPAPLEDAKRVDEFRKEVGLEPLSEYNKQIQEIYSQKDKQKKDL